MSTAFVLDELTAGHHQMPAVREFSLTVRAGEIVALLGPNGAGKTTTLDTACGVLPAMSGTVSLSGHPVRHMGDAARRGLSYVPEGRGLVRQLTVDENLRLRARSRRAVDDVYARFETLARLRGRQAGLLSGGEQQLLSVVCALSLKPQFLLIDEMTMGLAPTVVQSLAKVIRQVADEGIGVLFVEQHVHFALELCDRAYVLSGGRCVMQGSGRELLERVDELSASYFSGDPSVVG